MASGRATRRLPGCTTLQQVLVQEQVGRVTNALAWSATTPPSWFVPVATPYQIDNNNNQIILVAFVPATDSTLAISGAIMRYTLQVSPAPPTATFGDVPAGSLYFQFVEALAAAGVTAGCDAVPNYCPDRPITRAEMAVFLAKALGLQFQ